MKALGNDAYEFDSCWKAKRAAEGYPLLEMSPDEIDDWLDEQALRFAERLAKALSTKGSQNPLILARALEHYCGRKLPDLLRELTQLVPSGIDDDKEDF